jgi:hypothetical protein
VPSFSCSNLAQSFEVWSMCSDSPSQLARRRGG